MLWVGHSNLVTPVVSCSDNETSLDTLKCMARAVCDKSGDAPRICVVTFCGCA